MRRLIALAFAALSLALAPLAARAQLLSLPPSFVYGGATACDSSGSFCLQLQNAAANVFTVTKAGAGVFASTVTATQFDNGSGGFTITGTGGAQPRIGVPASTTAGVRASYTSFGLGLNASTAIVQTFFQLNPTITQSNTAGFTAFSVNADESGGVGSGVRLLADFQVTGTSKASITDAGVVVTQVTTVGSLPTCNSALKGGRSFVTDANAATFLTAAAAGGANNVPVVCDGTSWKIG